MRDESRRLANRAGLGVTLNANGSIRRIELSDVMLNLFPGNEVEAGPANLWLRRHIAGGIDAVPLLGPTAPTQPCGDAAGQWRGEWAGLALQLQLVLAESDASWFWHLQLRNTTPDAQTVDLVLVHDIGLSSHAAIRLNEHYVSHYVDLTPLRHAAHGHLLAARQNLAVDGRHPWAVFGSLRRGVSFATDALQVHGLALRSGAMPAGIVHGLAGARLQHEHALVAIQDASVCLGAGESIGLGFFAHVEADHAGATGAADLAHVDAALALPEAHAPGFVAAAEPAGPARSLFATAPMLATLDLDAAQLATLFGPRRHDEFGDDGALLSFFCGDARHVVLRAKELLVQRPHGHILRTGSALTPDESALTSTVWMGGVFHSMLTQGHVSINRFLSTVHSWLGLFRSHGQRVFVEVDGRWQLLGLPSAFEIERAGCRWVYRYRGGLVELRSAAGGDARSLTLGLRVLEGPPLRLLVSHHVAMGGDNGASALPPAPLQRIASGGVCVGVPAGSELAKRFPRGSFAIEPEPGTQFVEVGGDELLFEDGVARGQPFVCIMSSAVAAFGLRITGRLLPQPLVVPRLRPPAASALAADVARLDEILPWYLHNALVHYLSPRGLEQYSGGGWGTRDICQGPLEMLLALGQTAPVRDLLLRLFAAQNPDGDWPQWFTFFERERSIRSGDSHGDIVFWPLLALARYLLASGDAALLDESVVFFAADGEAAERASVWQHIERALGVIARRRIPGTHLAAYGHGDWNDSLQPADPLLRERLCSAWTVTLHHQTLRTLASALRRSGRAGDADAFDAEAAAVRGDFQRLLIVDGVVTGYALFPADAPAQLLLHPSDRVTGVHYSLLPMMHAILDDMLDPAQARAQLALIRAHLSGPDGARLFDRPLPYRGGPERLFQRAESSAFFGREVGVMYAHAHLRYAETLAHLGDAEALFDALRKAHPIGLREQVPSAARRQANCYFSSSDAAFADRYEALADYHRVADGSVALEGGWRIYSSGPGIALGLVAGRLLGIRHEGGTLVVDPVVPNALDGLRARLAIDGVETELQIHVGVDGHGPTAIHFNGHALPFERAANPYRIGAARVPLSEIAGRRRIDGDDLLVVTLG